MSLKSYVTVVLMCTSLKILLSISSFAYWPLIYLIWINVYSNLLPIFKLVYLCFLSGVVIALYIFWILDFYHIYDCQIFTPNLWIVFSFS